MLKNYTLTPPSGPPSVVLGIDPGIDRCGFAIITPSGRGMHVVDFGCITTPRTQTTADRLIILQKELDHIMVKYKPTSAAVEKLFFFKNAKTIIEVSQARGIIIAALAARAIPTGEYTPLEIKQAVTGYGRADKTQVIKMIRNILPIPPNAGKQPDDAFDALAIAYTHLTIQTYHTKHQRSL